jgi:RHS repeat-associated protein
MAAMMTTYRLYRHFAIAFGFVLLLAPAAFGQITNVTSDTMTPILGARHDYIGMMNETVNPANGSLSVRIGVPVPPGRGLTLPFSFNYDSNGTVHQYGSVNGQGQWAQGGGYLYSGGWTYSVPLLNFNSQTEKVNGVSGCTVKSGYVFTDAAGTRHALGLGFMSPVTCGQTTNSMGDDIYRASFPSSLSSYATPVSVADRDGTTYTFLASNSELGAGVYGITTLASSVEDRNGNVINIADNGSGSFSVTDTLGRSVISSSGFGVNGSNFSLKVSGLSPYYVYWGQNNSPGSAVNQTLVAGSYCNGLAAFPGIATPVVTAIMLPNGQEYQFLYDSTYGLVQEIIYPSGGYVRYVWKLSSYKSAELSNNVHFTDSQGNVNGCEYNYDVPALYERAVSFDGTNEVLDQTFTYDTTWNGGAWTSKTTQVETTVREVVNGSLTTVGSYTTDYTYSSVPAVYQPYDNAITDAAIQIPVESEVTYYDWGGGSPIRTVAKSWADLFEMQGQQIQNNGVVISDQFFVFGPGGQITDKYECGSGQTCYNATQTSPPTAYARHTQTVYQSFGATPIYTAGPSIFDRPASIYVYDGSGNKWSDTNYDYDGGSLTGASATNHDNTNYGTANNANRGNATQMTRWVNSGSGTTLPWSYTYDDTGQLLTMTDPKGNETRYSYNDQFPACDSPGPPGSTNAYLTQIVDAKGFTQNFTYRYCDGQLNSAEDRNSQTTSYTYADSLDRLTGIAYPDGGSTAYSYTSICPQPSMTTIALTTGGSSYQESAAMDGLCRVTQTAHSDPAGSTCTTSISGGADCTATIYDGVGRVLTVSNPYRTANDPTYGVTTYTYDALGRLNDEGSAKSIKRPDGSTVSTQNSANCVTIIDEAGVTRTSCTDELARMSQVTDATGTTTYGHNALNNLTSVSQGSQTRTFDYDSLGRLTSASNPESGTTTYTYPVSNSSPCSGDPSDVCTRTDARGIVATYTYNDALNRVTSKTYSDGTPTAGFGYDGTSVTLGSWTSPTLQHPVGRLTHTMTTSSGTTLTATVQDYDAMGRAADYWQCTPMSCGASSIWATNYSYDLAGDLTSWNHPAGFTITQGIDAARHISTVTSTVSGSTYPTTLATGPNGYIGYTPWGAVSTLENGCADGSGSSCANTVETYAYNNRMQMVMAELGNTSSATAISCRVYNFYAGTSNPSSCAMPSQSTTDNGNVAGYYYTDSANSGLAHTASYTYDGANRLASAAATGSVAYSQSFSYDIYGNMSCSANPAETNCLQTTYSSSTNRISYVTVNGVNTTYTYDAAGNLLNDGTYSYQWDAEGRLAAVTLSGNVVSMNTYNALGQRVEDVTQSSTTEEAYGAGGNLLLRYTGDSNSRSFVPFVGGILAEYYCGGVIFDHPDELGSATTATDCTGKNVQERLYYPFGEFWNGAGSLGMHQMFAQLPDYDPETDQYVTPNRHYAPMGRWLTPDPSGVKAARLDDPQTWNMYAYVRNNPTTLTDPTGLDFMTACTEESETCGHVEGYEGLYEGVTASTGENGELEFTPTVVTQEGGELHDQYGMTYGGDFDQGGVHLWSADKTVSGSGQFVEGTKETDLFGQGLYFGVEGKFVDACGGSCKARGSIYDLIPGAVGRAEDALNQRGAVTTFFDRLSGAHDKGTQWMDSAGLNHVIRFAPGTRNAGKTELHFEGSAVQGIDVIPHLAGALKDLVTGSAAAHRDVVLP